jgi:hypothetical protein
MITLDCNVLLIFLIGRYYPDYLSKFKRTAIYPYEYFEFLLEIINREKLIISTYVLTEASNLLESLEHHNEKIGLFALKNLIEIVDENSTSSKKLILKSSFIQFGLADSSIEELCEKGNTAIKIDLPLYGYLINKGYRVINLNHFWNAKI